MIEAKNITGLQPNRGTCITLFCTAALFETAFLSLTVNIWNIQSLSAYFVLVLALQSAACLKAIIIWRIHRYPSEITVYIICAIIAGSITYLTIETFRAFELISLTPQNSLVIALIDALLSIILLYGIREWMKVVLKSEPLRLAQQIRHHFLFNTLNTTICRINENPRLAQDNLEKLADLLRKILLSEIYISIEEELATVRCYLGIEKYRLRERLQVNWSLDYKVKNVIKIPALILQPLVENAIYHGIEKVDGGGTIFISLSTIKDHLIIQVRNPLSDTDYSDFFAGNRIAQTNIENRLALVYGNNFSFKREQYETEYCATIKIPIGGLIL